MPHSPLYLRSLRKSRTKRVVLDRMPTHRKIRIGGVRKRLPVSYFWKDVINTGRFVHPVTGEKFEVTQERIDGWIKKYDRMRKAGIEIPTPVDHSDKASDNRGFVVGARRKGDKLQLLHQVIGEDAVKLAVRNRCSVFIEPDFKDEHGRNWGEVIAHSAFTPKPVISGQGEFVPFAASRSGGRTSKVPIFYQSRNDVARNNKRRIKLSKAVDAAKPEFSVGDTVTLVDGTTGTVKKAVDVTAYQIEDDNGDTLPWEIEDDLTAEKPQKLSRGRSMKKKNKRSALSPKQLKKARKILNLEDDVELSDSEILSRLISANKLRKAAANGLGEDDETADDEEEDDDDVLDENEDLNEDEDDDEEDDDEAGAVDSEDEDEEDDDEDEEETEDDDEASARKSGKGSRRQRLLAKRRQRKVRELAGSVGSLSRVPKNTDPATLSLLKRSLKTERRRAIERGAITPEVDEMIADLLFTKGKPNGLALSRVGGSNEPLAFRLYDILRKNKPTTVSRGERSPSQERLALSRSEPGGVKGEKKELAALREEVRKTMQGQKKPGKQNAAKLD
jgi:hypothetical protein